jgi:hypothetical protein
MRLTSVVLPATVKQHDDGLTHIGGRHVPHRPRHAHAMVRNAPFYINLSKNVTRVQGPLGGSRERIARVCRARVRKAPQMRTLVRARRSIPSDSVAWLRQAPDSLTCMDALMSRAQERLSDGVCQLAQPSTRRRLHPAKRRAWCIRAIDVDTIQNEDRPVRDFLATNVPAFDKMPPPQE